MFSTKLITATTFLLVLPFLLIGQHNLTVSIPTEDAKGTVLLGLFNGPNLYLESEGMYRHCTQEVNSSTTICSIEDLPEGDYSIALLVDLNGNKKMDFTWIGWPKENYGFYPDPGFLMRKPKWKECNFRLNSNLEIEIKIK